MKFGKKDILDFGIFIAIITIATALKAIYRYDSNNSYKEVLPTQHKPKAAVFEMCVYIDNVGALHTQSTCKGIKPFMTVDSIKIDKIRKEHLKKICARCVNNEQLEELNKLK